VSVDENISDGWSGVHRLELLCLNSRGNEKRRRSWRCRGMMDEFGGDK